MSATMNQERLLQVILAPQITEKATHVADKHQKTCAIRNPCCACWTKWATSPMVRHSTGAA